MTALGAILHRARIQDPNTSLRYAGRLKLCAKSFEMNLWASPDHVDCHVRRKVAHDRRKIEDAFGRLEAIEPYRPTLAYGRSNLGKLFNVDPRADHMPMREHENPRSSSCARTPRFRTEMLPAAPKCHQGRTLQHVRHCADAEAVSTLPRRSVDVMDDAAPGERPPAPCEDHGPHIDEEIACRVHEIRSSLDENAVSRRETLEPRCQNACRRTLPPFSRSRAKRYRSLEISEQSGTREVRRDDTDLPFRPMISDSARDLAKQYVAAGTDRWGKQVREQKTRSAYALHSGFARISRNALQDRTPGPLPRNSRARQSTYEPMKILVTGGAGFIGSHLVDRLVAEGHDVRIYDNLEPQVHGNTTPSYLNRDAEFIQADICDEAMLDKAATALMSSSTKPQWSAWDRACTSRSNIPVSIRLAAPRYSISSSTSIATTSRRSSSPLR